LAADLAQITFDYPFRIPPYFALIIRAIGVLEGIALVGDPEFAIVAYIAQVSIQPFIQLAHPPHIFLRYTWTIAIATKIFLIFYQRNTQRRYIYVLMGGSN
jgi:predicted unusual protein kinase regulating ubiquinone biosynthesis (AarF/ABC1/UbiB family)